MTSDVVTRVTLCPGGVGGVFVYRTQKSSDIRISEPCRVLRDDLWVKVEETHSCINKKGHTGNDTMRTAGVEVDERTRVEENEPCRWLGGWVNGEWTCEGKCPPQWRLMVFSTWLIGGAKTQVSRIITVTGVDVEWGVTVLRMRQSKLRWQWAMSVYGLPLYTDRRDLLKHGKCEKHIINVLS